MNKTPEKKILQYALIKFIVSGNLRMHMEHAQYDQASMNMIMKHNLTIQEQSLKIVTTMNIHTVNEHPDIQENKLNAKYHLHVQHSIDARSIRF